MKIKQLEIPLLHQFHNASFDFTYPKGHPNAGKPMDKICFIGQSGTGKTTLLQVLKNIIIPRGNSDFIGVSASVIIEDNHFKITYDDQGRMRFADLKTGKMTHSDISQYIKIYSQNKDTLLMEFPSDFLTVNNTLRPSANLHYHNTNIFNFGEIDIPLIWDRILDSIKQHKAEVLEVRTKLAEVTQLSDNDPKKIEDEISPLLARLKVLIAVENNPLNKLANEYLDAILGYFNLKVNTELKVADDLSRAEFLKIEDGKGNIIPNGLLSTGTKQFLLSSLPFYLLKPSKAIILFDEPERSLYPNIQKILVQHYSKFANDSQFFYATHSPIIASCFDPWEVIELQFGSDGFIVQKPYFKGVRHVDNYYVHPKYLTYELILKEVFDVSETEGEERSEKLTELAMYENELDAFKKKEDSNSDKFKAVLNKYLKLAEQLSWPKKFN